MFACAGVRGDSQRAHGQLAAHVRVGAARGAGVAGVRGQARAPARGAHGAAVAAVRTVRPHYVQPPRLAQQHPAGEQGDATINTIRDHYFLTGFKISMNSNFRTNYF